MDLVLYSPPNYYQPNSPSIDMTKIVIHTISDIRSNYQLDKTFYILTTRQTTMANLNISHSQYTTKQTTTTIYIYMYVYPNIYKLI